MKEVTGSEREEFLFNKLGKAFMVFENNLYDKASAWDSNYLGGYWGFYEVEGRDEEMEQDVKAWFMAIDTIEELTATTYCDVLQTDAMTWSVALNLTLFSLLSFHYDEKGDAETAQVFANAYHSLKDAAFSKLIPDLDLSALAKIID